MHDEIQDGGLFSKSNISNVLMFLFIDQWKFHIILLSFRENACHSDKFFLKSHAHSNKNLWKFSH